MQWCSKNLNQNSKTDLVIIPKQPRKEYNQFQEIKCRMLHRINLPWWNEMMVRCWNFENSLQTGQTSDNRIWIDILWHINSSAFRYYCRNQIVAAHLPPVKNSIGGCRFCVSTCCRFRFEFFFFCIYAGPSRLNFGICQHNNLFYEIIDTKYALIWHNMPEFGIWMGRCCHIRSPGAGPAVFASA